MYRFCKILFVRQPFAGHHLLHHADIGGDVDDVGLKQRVELPLEGDNDLVEQVFDLLHPLGDVFRFETLVLQRDVLLHKLDRSRQIIVEELPDLTELFRVFPDAVEDLRRQPLDEIDLGAYALVRDLVVQTADIGDGALALIDDRLQLRRELFLRLWLRLRFRILFRLLRLGLLRRGSLRRLVRLFAGQHDAQDRIHDRRHDRAGKNPPEGVQLAGVQQPYDANGINRKRGALLFCVLFLFLFVHGIPFSARRSIFLDISSN